MQILECLQGQFIWIKSLYAHCNPILYVNNGAIHNMHKNKQIKGQIGHTVFSYNMWVMNGLHTILLAWLNSDIYVLWCIYEYINADKLKCKKLKGK